MADKPMPSSFDDDREYQETGSQKVWRKLKEEPLVPLGTLLTCAALYNAWRGMRRGDHAQVQRMFRARIGAQAFTVCAIVAGGAYYGKDREKRQELIKLEAQQRAEERNAREEQQLQDHINRRRERRQQQAREGKTATSTAAASTPSGETTSDAEGQVPLEGKKEGSTVLGALSQSGSSWFGSGKKKEDTPSSSDEKK
ncbi:mitochondrial hypoxia responsive domain containing protein [Apiospora hydei]|uniref:Mitochondrial hypoxia responsive domain containing protein n=1 Tax=Apiospora hydei TaxID=1337664 RepID=A0ABR1VZF2_9PEZI